MKIRLSNAEKVCRACLSESDELKPLQAKLRDNNKTVLDAINFVANIDIVLGNGLPDKICNDCECKLDSADVFKGRCLQSETIIGQHLAALKNELKSEKLPLSAEKKDLKLPEKSSDRTLSLSNLECYEPITTVQIINENVDDKDATLIVGRNEIKVEIEPLSDKEETDLVIDEDRVHYEPEVLINEYAKLNTLDNKDSKPNPRTKKWNLKDRKKKEKKQNITESADKETFTCQHCDKVFHKRESYTTHLSRKHNPKNIGNFECAVCKKAFPTRYNFKVHMRTHVPKVKKVNTNVYTCQMCKREFSFKSNLTKHIRSMHHGCHKCKECENVYPDKESLEAHKLGHRKDRFTQVCPICGVTLKTTVHCLIVHMRRHQKIKPFKCQECEKSFVTRRELTVHKTVHTGERPYLCSICGRGFTAAASVKTHVNTVHGTERPFSCDLCPRAFKTLAVLKGHRISHTDTNIKPHKCFYCEASFRRKDRFRRHLRSKHAQEIANSNSGESSRDKCLSTQADLRHDTTVLTSIIEIKKQNN